MLLIDEIVSEPISRILQQSNYGGGMPSSFSQYLSIVESSLEGTIFGFFLIFFCIYLLWKTEHALIDYGTILNSCYESTLVVQNSNCMQKELEGLPIMISGRSEVLDSQSFDSTTGYQADYKAIKMSRVVEMYQWYEIVQHHEEGQRGKPGFREWNTYTYAKRWGQDSPNNNQFNQPLGHYNPPRFPNIMSENWCANHVSIGAYDLNETQINMIHNFQACQISKPVTPAMVHAFGGLFGELLFVLL